MCIRDSAEGVLAKSVPGLMLPLHYVVVAGLDEKRELVLLNDPAQRKLLKEDRSEFEQEWQVAPTRHH